MEKTQQTITVLGKTFNSEEERRNYFREELRKKLPELKQMEGFPIGEDEDILNLSDPPYYTACPNPWLNEFVAEWEASKTGCSKKVVNSPFPEDIKAGKNHAIYNAHTYHTKVPHEITSKFLLYYTNPGDIIIDSFAGTGMTGVGGSFCDTMDNESKYNFNNDFKRIDASFELGKRNVINIDLSSIASHISLIHNSRVDLDSLNSEYTDLIKTLQNHESVYQIENGARIGKTNYTVFSQIYICNNCSENFDFYTASYDKENNFRENPICPHCNFSEKKSDLTPLYETKIDFLSGDPITQIVHKPILVNYSINNKRHILHLDEGYECDKKLESRILVTNIPNIYLIDGVETKRNDKYGYTKVHHFYTHKTLYFISLYLDTINRFRHKNHFIFLLTAILPKLTKLNRFMPQHGSRALVGPMANTLYLPPLYVENNFLDQVDFQFKKIAKALKFSTNQVVSQQSATSLNNIPSDSIDYIFIDPPFGANIMYSELNNLSEAWLRILTNNKDEAIESKGQNKSKFDYESLMTKSFNELFRVLKPNSWMTVEFSNTSASIWNIIQNGLNRTGFIVAKVDALNKTRGGLHAMLGPVAVKQDLVISCYKPSEEFLEDFIKRYNEPVSIWNFIELHLNHLPVHVNVDKATTAIIERSSKILFDRLIAFYVQKGLPVPIDAGAFQKGLRERFIERDGMFFTNVQVQEYDQKKAENPELIQLSILVSSEQEGVLWLKNLLTEKSLAYQDIQPLWMQALAGARKGDIIPELAAILDDNFLKDEQGKWFVPNPEKEGDLEKLRTKRLLKQFEACKTEAAKPKGKIKEVRVEALRAGFKEAYQDKDFKTIVQIGDRIPNNLLMEDEVLLQFYDIAVSRV